MDTIMEEDYLGSVLSASRVSLHEENVFLMSGKLNEVKLDYQEETEQKDVSAYFSKIVESATSLDTYSPLYSNSRVNSDVTNSGVY